MRVKICGITSVADAAAAVRAGVDAIGLNFVGGPRLIGTETAAAILESLPPLVTPVALVKLEQGGPADSLVSLLTRYQVSLLQVHGGFTTDAAVRLSVAGFCSIPVVAVRGEDFTSEASGWLSEQGGWRPKAVVLDTYVSGREGGTGRAFRWDWVKTAREAGRLTGWPPIILAGGLNPDNVDEAIRIARPYAVDVSSGVEIEGAPGRKDFDRMWAFVHRARAAFERNGQ